MAIIADSTALISMAKIGRLELLKKLYVQVIIAKSVHDEVVVEGKRLRKPEVNKIEKAMQAKWISVVSLTAKQLHEAEMYRLSVGIGKGEAESIVLAKDRKLSLIFDDKYARDLADTVRLEFLGTGAVLLQARLRAYINKKEFLESLRDLGKVMWLSPEVIAELVKLSEEVK